MMHVEATTKEDAKALVDIAVDINQMIWDRMQEKNYIDLISHGVVVWAARSAAAATLTASVMQALSIDAHGRYVGRS